MQAAPDLFVFSKVRSSEAAQAFAFHKAVALSDPHIWLRTEQQIKHYANQGSLYAVRRSSSGAYVALCYVVMDSGEWEVGGLTVSPEVRRLGIAAALTRFAIAHTLVYLQPLRSGQDVITHVHEENNSPRHLLESLGFEWVKRVPVPSADAPATMKRNADGNVYGDKFKLVRDGIRLLCCWFQADAFDNALSMGHKLKIELGPIKVDDLRIGLKDIAKSAAGCAACQY